MRTLALLSVLTVAAAPVGESRLPEPPSVAIHCGTLYVSATRKIEDCWLVVADGKIAAVIENGAPPPDLPTIDASDKTVMAGLVVADTDISGHGDDEYNVTPDFVALDGFDFLRDYRAALSGGVTTVYLAPGRNRLISGQGSVVKLAGDDMVRRVLAESACLRITLGEASTKAPPIFEPTVFPTADEPLEPARRQYPTARISQLATLRQLFRDAQATPDDAAPDGAGPVEGRFSAEALRRASLGGLRLRIAAREAADVRRAIAFADELGAKPVLENPADIARASPWLRDVPIVFRAPVRLSDSNPGGENRRDKTVLDLAENPALAARAGAQVALAPGRSEDLADMLLIAGIAARYGLPAAAALAAITSTAADVLGVGDRVGTLAVGMDADFLVLSGDPLDVGTMVEQTWIDGTKVYQRHTESTLIAIRATRIITGTGESIRDGVVLVADGKIRGVGTDLAIPFGARIIDIEGVVTPGFIDAHSTLGLSGDGIGVPNGSADQRVADVLRFDDPTFQPALAAGVTTLFVSGADQALVSGRVAAVKTGAVDHASMVIRELAAVRFVFDEIGLDAAKPLEAEIEKGKKYIEAWQKYEKALADFEAGKTAKPPEEAPAAPKAAEADPLSGVWECEIEIPQSGRAIALTLDLKLAGTAVTGTAQISFGENQLPESPIEGGTFQNGELRASLSFMRNQSELVAKIADDTLQGTVQAMGQESAVTGRRTTKAGEARPAKTVTDDGKPKKPNVDEAMEAMRALLEKRATAVVRVDRAPAIATVMKVFADAGIRTVLQSAEDLVDTPGLVEKPVVMLGPELVRREQGQLVNAPARLADVGAELAIVTGDNAGTRYLPLHAMHAIRYGMDPEAALRALTIGPAHMLGLDDRIGSLARGKDADLVVFSGSPFAPTSQVLLVMCNGRIVHDAREKETR